MKNIFKLYYLGVLLLCVTMTSCHSDSKLKSLVREINDGCPAVTASGTINSVTYKDKTVTLVFVANDENLNFDSFNKHPKEVKEQGEMLIGTYEKDEHTKLLLNEMIDCEAGFCVVYKNQTNRTKTKITLTSAEIKSAMEKYKNTSKNLLNVKMEVNGANMQMPNQVDEITVANSLKLIDKDIVYDYTVDMDDAMWSLFEQHSGDLKSECISNLVAGATTNAEVKQLVSSCVTCHLGIIYIYHKKGSDSSIKLTLTQDDLQTVLYKTINRISQA